MIYFGKKAALYANDSYDHTHVGLFPCSACGALVTEPNKAGHTEWHEGVNEQIKALENKPATYPVVIHNPPYTLPYTYPQTLPYIWYGNQTSTISSGGSAGGNTYTGGNTAGTQITWSTQTANLNSNLTDTTDETPPNEDDDGDCGCDCDGYCE